MLSLSLQDGKWEKLETESEEEEDAAVANGTASTAPEFCELLAERGDDDRRQTLSWQENKVLCTIFNRSFFLQGLALARGLATTTTL